MPQHPEGIEGIIFSDAEVEVVRAALFIALYHRDDVASKDDIVQTLTGIEISDIAALLRHVDELTGNEDQIRWFLSAEMNRLSALDDRELQQHSSYAVDVLGEAVRHEVPISRSLQERIDASLDGPE